MDKQEFLTQPDVTQFLEWLKTSLPMLRFHLNIKKSRFNPVAVNTTIIGLHAVLQHYAWRSTWLDQNGENVISCDWISTCASLERLGDFLRAAVDKNDERATLSACIQILRWGGVKGAENFIKRMSQDNSLIEYLKRSATYFDLNGGACLNEIDADTIQHFDSGMTKIHSLFDKSGSPIYDSRVGASMAMFYRLYQIQMSSSKQFLNFPCGSARGKQIRNPGSLGFKAAPQFYTKDVPPHVWARYQVKLGWIIEQLAGNDWFFGQGISSIPQRCRAIKAALFMIGYDLRSLALDSARVVQA